MFILGYLAFILFVCYLIDIGMMSHPFWTLFVIAACILVVVYLLVKPVPKP